MFTGIIGGADGPTRIFLAGSLTNESIILIAAIVISILFLAAAGTRIHKMVKKSKLEKLEQTQSEAPEEAKPEGSEDETGNSEEK